MKKLLLLLSLLAVVSCGGTKVEGEGNNSENAVSEEKTEITNKEKAIAVLAAFGTGDKTGVQYINPDKYIQHNLGAKDGLKGFLEIINSIPEGGYNSKVVRAYEDGDYVFVQTDSPTEVGFDVFRFENGMIVEHWDNLAEKAKNPNPSGHTQTDGAVEVKDLDKTEENKNIVSNFVNDILVKSDMNKIGNYIVADNYTQHNTAIGDGSDGLINAFKEMAKQGITIKYNTVHKILGEGNFVLAISEGEFAGKPTSFYDLFRVENGKIVEHWDILETIIPEDKRQNSNGKFNF